VNANTDAREVEHLGVARTNEEMLPVMGAAPAMAEGTTGIELAGRAEQATAAKPEALEPRASGEVEGSAFEVTRTCHLWR